MELWDILNSEGKLVGCKARRGRMAFKQGEYHLVVHIWPYTSDGEFLIQRRSLRKKLMPGRWAATGGAAISGEDSFDAAKRELFEELGIVSNKNSLKFIKRTRRRSSIIDIWAINIEKKQPLSLQRNEVAGVKWVNWDKFMRMVECGEFHNYGVAYFDTLSESIIAKMVF